MTKKSTFLVLFIRCFFIITYVYGDPSPTGSSGTLADGNSYTITGSGFGSHADFGGAETYLNFKWDDFDDNNIADVFGFRDDVTLTTASPRTGSTHHVTRDKDNSVGGIGESSNTSANGKYTTFWMRVPSGTTYGSSAQNKIVRIGQASYGYPNITFGKHESTGSRNHIATVEGSSSSIVFNDYLGNSTIWDDGNWHRVETWFKPSSGVGNSDGEIFYRIDQNVLDNLDRTNITTDNGSSNSYGGKWAVTAYLRQFSQDVLIDDLFFDYTLARVEICNASTRASATICEIQIPTAWSDTSITFDVNAGAFGANETVWAYVHDSANNFNPNGLERDFGTGSSTPSISSISGSPFEDGELVTIIGEGFEATQGTGNVQICDDPTASGICVDQTETAWSDASVSFNASRGSLAKGSTGFVILTNNSTSSTEAFQIQFEPEPVEIDTRFVRGSGSIRGSALVKFLIRES